MYILIVNNANILPAIIAANTTSGSFGKVNPASWIGLFCGGWCWQSWKTGRRTRD